MPIVLWGPAGAVAADPRPLCPARAQVPRRGGSSGPRAPSGPPRPAPCAVGPAPSGPALHRFRLSVPSLRAQSGSHLPSRVWPERFKEPSGGAGARAEPGDPRPWGPSRRLGVDSAVRCRAAEPAESAGNGPGRRVPSGGVRVGRPAVGQRLGSSG